MGHFYFYFFGRGGGGAGGGVASSRQIEKVTCNGHCSNSSNKQHGTVPMFEQSVVEAKTTNPECWRHRPGKNATKRSHRAVRFGLPEDRYRPVRTGP